MKRNITSLTRMTKIKRFTNPFWQACGATWAPYIAGGNVRGYKHFENRKKLIKHAFKLYRTILLPDLSLTEIKT